MDTSSRPFYVEPSAWASLDPTTSFVEKCYSLDEVKVLRLIEPILMSRLVHTCSDALPDGIGELAARQVRGAVPLRIQSRLAESEDQVPWVKSTRHTDDTDVFDSIQSFIQIFFALTTTFHSVNF